MGIASSTSRWLALLIVCFVCQSTQAQQNPNGQPPISASSEPYLFLLRDPLVHTELKLTKEQKVRLQTSNDQLDDSLWPMWNQPLEQVNAKARRLKSKTKQQLSKILERDQLRRLDEIEMWMLGMKAFLRPDIAEKLK